MLHLRGADTMSKTGQCPVSSGMGITTYYGKSGHGSTQLWPHHMHNTLAKLIHLVFFDTKMVAIIIKGLNLNSRCLVGNRRHTGSALIGIG